MLDKMFLSHPRSVGESYGEHFMVASGFGAKMVAGGVACIVHALVPAWFERAGSDTIKALYAKIMARQPAFAKRPPAFTESQWQLDYEI